jgi:hypothetical protein
MSLAVQQDCTFSYSKDITEYVKEINELQLTEGL